MLTYPFCIWCLRSTCWSDSFPLNSTGILVVRFIYLNCVRAPMFKGLNLKYCEIRLPTSLVTITPGTWVPSLGWYSELTLASAPSSWSWHEGKRKLLRVSPISFRHSNRSFYGPVTELLISFSSGCHCYKEKDNKRRKGNWKRHKFLFSGNLHHFKQQSINLEQRTRKQQLTT